MTLNEWPRRNKIYEMTDAERAIYDAVSVVEAAGSDVRLTDAVILLAAARASVADFVDDKNIRRHVQTISPDTAGASYKDTDALIDAVDEYLAALQHGDIAGSSSDGTSWGERVRMAQGRIATLACIWRKNIQRTNPSMNEFIKVLSGVINGHDSVPCFCDSHEKARDLLNHYGGAE